MLLLDACCAPSSPELTTVRRSSPPQAALLPSAPRRGGAEARKEKGRGIWSLNLGAQIPASCSRSPAPSRGWGQGVARAVKSPRQEETPGCGIPGGPRLALGCAPACLRQRGLCLSLWLTRGLYSPWSRRHTHLQAGLLWASLPSLLSTHGADPSEGSCQGCARTGPWRRGLSAADRSWQGGGSSWPL